MSKLPSSFPKIQLSLLILVLTSVPFWVNSQSPTSERTVLLNLKQGWGNPPSIQSWNSSSSPCDWPEMRCTNGMVTGIILRDKNITGKLPPTICDLQNLTKIDLANNNIPGEFPTVLYNCSKLEYLDLSWNHLAGPIPGGIHRMSSLRYLNLGLNYFSNIPVEIGQLTELQNLFLDRNYFNCSIPPELGNLSNLETLAMENNEELVPSKIPPEFAGLKKLKFMHMSQTNSNGEFPKSVIASLSSLETLDLSINYLRGPIPGEWFRLKNLSHLLLNSNYFSGHIPAQVKALNLVIIDLSYNHLTGSIPKHFGKLYKLEYLYLSGNQLSGRIPHEFQNKSSYDFTFDDNLNLCADYPIPNLPRCNHKNHVHARGALGRVILIVAISIGFVAIILSSFFLARYCQRRRKQRESKMAEWKLIWFHRLGFTESDILSSLTEDNLIGSGGSGKVYRVAINQTGEHVAVKRISNDRKLDHRLDKEFLAEVQILGTIRHSNVVKLLCCISSENSKLLVYEYMENQSLDIWLHGKKRSTSSVSTSSVQHIVLDWPMRLHIAIGTAKGLCYMHHDCSPSIIHRDMKSSNIVLDPEFNAKISDFGLAKVLAKRGDPETASAVAGTFGYIAPEYAYTTKVNVKSDIYSFGVVLLELATGREPINADEHINLAQWAWQHYQDGNSIVDALDEEIKEPCYLEEMAAVFKLGLVCTSTLPSTRPSMKEVLQILQCCDNHLQGGLGSSS